MVQPAPFQEGKDIKTGYRQSQRLGVDANKFSCLCLLKLI